MISRTFSQNPRTRGKSNHHYRHYHHHHHVSQKLRTHSGPPAPEKRSFRLRDCTSAQSNQANMEKTRGRQADGSPHTETRQRETSKSPHTYVLTLRITFNLPNRRQKGTSLPPAFFYHFSTKNQSDKWEVFVHSGGSTPLSGDNAKRRHVRKRSLQSQSRRKVSMRRVTRS